MKARAVITLIPLLALAGCEYKLRRPNNYPCATAAQCISGVCHADICVAVDPGKLEAVCIDNGDCRSLRCVNGACAKGSRAGGEACRFHEECKSGRCTGDRKCDVYTPPDGGPDAGRDAGPDAPRTDGPKDLGPTPEKPGDKGPKPEKTITPDLPVKDLNKDQAKPKDLPQGEKAKPKDLPQGEKATPKDLPKPPDKSPPADMPGDAGGPLNYSITPDNVAVTTSYAASSPAVATGKGQWLLAWQDDRHKSTPNIYGVRVKLDGTKEKTDLAITQAASGDRKRPAVAFDGSQYLVAWQTHVAGGGGKIEARTVGTSGATVSSKVLHLFDVKYKTGQDPAVACGGGKCLVVWVDNSTGKQFHVSGALIGSGSPKAVSINTASGTKSKPRVAYGDGRFLVVWEKMTNLDVSTGYQDIFGARVDVSGAVLDSGVTLRSTFNHHETDPALAYGGGQFLLAWKDEPVGAGPTPAIYAGRILGASKPPSIAGKPLLVKSSSDAQYPVVGHDGHAFVVLWSEGKTGSRTIAGKQVPHTGSPVALAYPTVASITGSLEHAVASGGWGRLMVVSQSASDDIYYTRMWR